MPTLPLLADLERGLILITGPRRSGKTHACSVILTRWEARGFSYRHFSENHSDRMSWYQGRSLDGRYWRAGPVSTSGLLGLGRCLIDDTPVSEDMVGPSPHLLVIATSTPALWMSSRADWIVHVRQPSIVEILQVERPEQMVPNRKTAWERLLDGVL